MSSELLELLIRSFVLSSLGIAAVLLLRSLWRRWLGSENVLRFWVLVPLLALIPLLPTRTIVVESAPESVSVQGLHSSHAVDARAEHPFAVNTVPVRVVSGSSRIDIVASALFIWGLGALLFGAVQLRRQRRYYQALGPLQREADGCYRSTRSDLGPMVIGLLRPLIVLPADFEQRYSPTQQQLVLQHERCHLARGDLWFVALAVALRCLFWFNPLAHLAWFRFREDQELACDAAIIRRWPSAKRAYAEAMIFSQATVPGLPVACTWQSSHPLQRRIEMLYSLAPDKGRRLGMFASLLIPCSLAGLAWAQNGVEVVVKTQHQAVPSASLVQRTGAPALPNSVQLIPNAATPRVATNTISGPEIRSVARAEQVVPAVASAPQDRADEVRSSAAQAELVPSVRPTEAVVPEAPSVSAVRVENLVIASSEKATPATALASVESLAASATLAADPSALELSTAPVSNASEDVVVLVEEPSAEGGNFVPARILYAELPSSPERLSIPSLVHYPGSAANRGEFRLPPGSGEYLEVLIEVELDESGKALRIDAIDAGQRHQDSRRYERTALRAIRDWRFEPALLDGEPVASTLLVPLNFERVVSSRRSLDHGLTQPLRPGENRRGPRRDPLGTEAWNGL